jgi:CubicO group peptidase (beta-lactamase class C family)
MGRATAILLVGLLACGGDGLDDGSELGPGAGSDAAGAADPTDGAGSGDPDGGRGDRDGEGGSGDPSIDPGDDPTTDPGDTDPGPDFAAVEAALEAAVLDGTLLGYSFALATEDGAPVLRLGGGDYAPDQPIPMDSCSKPLTGWTALQVVESGALSLDTRLADVLGWTGPEGDVTVRQLMSFTSGFDGGARCLSPPATLDASGNLVIRPNRSTLAECAETIRQAGLLDEPGTVFHYGGSHQNLLAHVVEVATGRRWDEIFLTEVLAPAGLSDEVFYASNRVAGSAVGQASAVAQLFWRMGSSAGRLPGTPTMNPELAAAFFRSETADPVDRADSPWRTIGEDVEFGLGIWIDCEGDDCIYVGSGANGSTAWIDPASGHAAALLLYQRDLRGYRDGYAVLQDILPRVREALSP